jgi:DNA-binding transcriptional LysR family regulator
MELRQLEHFVAVAEDESFTRAARRLGYVQSALSVSVQSIERELDVRLFDRTTHRVALTDAGHQLLGPARATLAAADEVRAGAAAVNGVLVGRLAIGIMQSFTTSIDLPAALGRFHRDHPGVELMMRPALGGATELLRSVADGALDIAFVSATNVPPSVNVRTLLTEPLVLVSAAGQGPSPGAAVSLTELAGASFVDAPLGWGTRTVIDRAYSELGLHRRVGIEVADIPTLFALVEQGLGVALMPASMIPPGREGLEHRPVTPAPVWEVVVATPGDRPLNAAAQAFLDLIDLPSD